MRSLPAMFAVFVFIAWQWGKSVDVLSRLVPAHTSLDSIDTDDEEDRYVLDGELQSADLAGRAAGAESKPGGEFGGATVAGAA